MANMIYVTPARRDYEVIAGNTFSDSFTVKVDGTPLDLTGWKARLQGRRYPEDPIPPIDLSTDNGAITLGDADGTVNILAEIATVRTWGMLAVTYQFEFEDVAGRVQTFLYGDFVVKGEYTE